MRKHQGGNAIVFILIGIALFGALSFTFMRGAKTGQGNLTGQQAKMAATDMMNYAALLNRTINKLVQKGCSENQINFYNTTYKFMDGTIASVNNPSAPTDHSCDVFNAAGGNITPVLLSSDYQGDSGGGSLASISLLHADIKNVGNPVNDIVIVIPHIRKDICLKINEQLDVPLASGDVPPYTAVTWPAQYYGEINDPSIQVGYDTTSSNVAGKFGFCIATGTAPSNLWGYMFYTVVLSR